MKKGAIGVVFQELIKIFLYSTVLESGICLKIFMKYIKFQYYYKHI